MKRGAFADYVRDYACTAEHNDRLFQEFTGATWADPLLTAHRRHVEEKQLGFGDAAFHTMWDCLLEAAAQRFGAVRALEIGIYKGQIISLWSLLARERTLDLAVSALGPLCGNPRHRISLLNRFRYRVDRRFREQVENGNFYADEDYPGIIRGHFAHHGLDFGQVRLHRGFSTDPKTLAGLEEQPFHIVYVDGDHSYAGALHDFKTFAGMIAPGGWIVADDAGGDLPGTAFWKGHAAVTRAAQVIPSLGFKNVLNVGHNRIYERISA